MGQKKSRPKSQHLILDEDVKTSKTIALNVTKTVVGCAPVAVVALQSAGVGVLGATMTGIGGSVILGVAVSYLIYYFMPTTLAKWRFIRGKIDGDKCTDICDAMLILDVPTLRGLDKPFVKSNYREKALIYHPDKWEEKNYSTEKKKSIIKDG